MGKPQGIPKYYWATPLSIIGSTQFSDYWATTLQLGADPGLGQDISKQGFKAVAIWRRLFFEFKTMCDNLGISDTKIEVYEIKFLGSTIVFKSLRELLETIEVDIDESELNNPNEITITKKMMRESEVDALPEFDGF